MYYIDCDGTLVDYDYRPREDVVAAVRALLSRGENVIVWSGGGVGYAAGVARMFFDGRVGVLAKDRRILTEQDVVVDDMDFEPPFNTARVLLPEQFVTEEAEASNSH